MKKAARQIHKLGMTFGPSWYRDVEENVSSACERYAARVEKKDLVLATPTRTNLTTQETDIPMSEMDKSKEALARLLNGREYRNEITAEEEEAAKKCGLVVLFGASDDLAEFRGVFNDEAGASNGTRILLDWIGPLPEREQVEGDEELEWYLKRQRKAATITAVLDKGGYSWQYQTEIPHATFEIVEGSEKYCLGIVFERAELPISLPVHKESESTIQMNNPNDSESAATRDWIKVKNALLDVLARYPMDRSYGLGLIVSEALKVAATAVESAATPAPREQTAPSRTDLLKQWMEWAKEETTWPPSILILDTERAIARQCSASPWIATAERAPTEKDSINYLVLTLNKEDGGFVDMFDWHFVADYVDQFPYWMPIPPLPKVSEASARVAGEEKKNL